jgi:deoxycytidine triphosphate deaminase
MTILATSAIADALQSGAIVCDPAPSRIEGAHIDITLGANYWRRRGLLALLWERLRGRVMDIGSDDPRRWFTPHTAHHRRIVVPAWGFILAHTQEAIGTAPGSGLVPNLHTRSTMARWGLSVCTANAGQGDEGWVGPWTLEIINPHPLPVVLWVGMRVGSLSFSRAEGQAAPYAVNTRYNRTKDTWLTLDMLPRKGNW